MPKAGCPGGRGGSACRAQRGLKAGRAQRPGRPGPVPREAAYGTGGRWKWSGVRDGGPRPRSPSCRWAAQDGSQPVSPSVKWANNRALLLGCREVTCQRPGRHGATGQPVTAALGAGGLSLPRSPRCALLPGTPSRSAIPGGRRVPRGAQHRKASGTRSPPSGACALTPSGPTPSTGPLGTSRVGAPCCQPVTQQTLLPARCSELRPGARPAALPTERWQRGWSTGRRAEDPWESPLVVGPGLRERRRARTQHLTSETSSKP